SIMKKINETLHDATKHNTPRIFYDEFKNITKIDRGGSSIIFKAKWKCDPKPIDVILKVFDDYNHFVNERNAYNKIEHKNSSVYYGISENEEKKHIIVLKHIQMGSLKKNFKKITQQNILNQRPYHRLWLILFI
ncbi:11611_t:CDS:2, partial [Gigaspora rosea]